MTTREFIETRFGNPGRPAHCSSVFCDQEGNIYSYGRHYPLLFNVDGLNFRNITGYSVTTAKHISYAGGFDAIDVRLNGLELPLALANLKKRLIEELDTEILRADKHRKGTQVRQVHLDRAREITRDIRRIENEERDTPEATAGTSHIDTVKTVMALGDIFCQDQKGRNDWKARMLKAGLEGRGLIMPDDWDELDEDTKEQRLNAVMEE